VAYADFVTAMMAFFMVMWILGMDENTKKAIEGYFANPVGYKKGAASGSSPVGVGNSPSRVQQAQLRLVIRNSETRTFSDVGERIRELVNGNEALKKLGAQIEVGARQGRPAHRADRGRVGRRHLPHGPLEHEARRRARAGPHRGRAGRAVEPADHRGPHRRGAVRQQRGLHELGALGRPGQRRAPRARGQRGRREAHRGGARPRRPPPAPPRAAARRRQPPHLDPPPFTNMPSPDRDSVPGMVAVPSVPLPRATAPSTARDGE
jgi:chemotaxis protein MotB